MDAAPRSDEDRRIDVLGVSFLAPRKLGTSQFSRPDRVYGWAWLSIRRQPTSMDTISATPIYRGDTVVKDSWYDKRRMWVGGWHVGFDTGSIVTLSLDSTKSEEGEGATMSVSVDDKAMIPVFDRMGITGHDKFYPAAYLFEGSSIEFLGFQ